MTQGGDREVRERRTETPVMGKQPSDGEGTSALRCQVWGVLNVTPDSFSDGGRFLDPARAIGRAEEMLEEGVDVIDIGGASSRPPGAVYGRGAPAVSEEEELWRVLTVLRPLVARTSAVLSVDTTSGAVAQAALAEGARIINDVSCARDPFLLHAVAAASADYVLMHNRQDGRVDGENARYADPVGEVQQELKGGVERAAAEGVAPSQIWLDPGLGFAKTPAQSVALLAATERLKGLGFPLLIGPSRKGFLASVAAGQGRPLAPPGERLGGTAAAVTLAVWFGARAVRVHDVQAAVQAVRLTEAVKAAREVAP